MFLVKVFPNYKPERQYILEVLLQEFLGLDYHIEYENRLNVCIKNSDGKKIILPDIFFRTPKNKWLKPGSLPRQPLQVLDTREASFDYNLVDSKIPIIYGKKWNKRTDDISIDIFGSTFFALSRYEEIVKADSDEHDRFPASASLAYQEGFINRPIVNEYLEILWYHLKKVWPGIRRRNREFKILLTHDVDRPFEHAMINSKKLLFRTVERIIRTRNLSFSFKPLTLRLKGLRGKIPDDPYNTFDWIMDISDRYGLASTFNFFGDRTGLKLDSSYRPKDRLIIELIRRIYKRGHKIGFHGSYNTYLNEQKARSEFRRLKAVCLNEGIDQKKWSGRQHYLRWRTDYTPQILDSIGLHFDSTIAFAERQGFRSGCVYEYSIYDIIGRKPLNLKEIPLIIMDRTLTSPLYMDLSTQQAIVAALQLKNTTRLFGGNFTILWHNNNLVTSEQKELYQCILNG
jgi:hypothetical protein